MPRRTKIYPMTPHGTAGEGLPSDREIYLVTATPTEERP